MKFLPATSTKEGQAYHYCSFIDFNTEFFISFISVISLEDAALFCQSRSPTVAIFISFLHLEMPRSLIRQTKKHRSHLIVCYLFKNHKLRFLAYITLIKYISSCLLLFFSRMGKIGMLNLMLLIMSIYTKHFKYNGTAHRV